MPIPARRDSGLLFCAAAAPPPPPLPRTIDSLPEAIAAPRRPSNAVHRARSPAPARERTVHPLAGPSVRPSARTSVRLLVSQPTTSRVVRLCACRRYVVALRSAAVLNASASPELARSGALAYAEEGWLRIFRIFNLL